MGQVLVISDVGAYLDHLIAIGMWVEAKNGEELDLALAGPVIQQHGHLAMGGQVSRVRPVNKQKII